MSLQDILEILFINNLREETVDLQTLKSFVAGKELTKIRNQIDTELSEIKRNLYNLKNIRALDDMLAKLNKFETINGILNTIPYDNIDGYVSIVDSCNISLNGEENCDIIVGRATEEELRDYVFKLEENKQKVK